MQLNNIISWGKRYLSLTLLIAVAVTAFVLFFNDNSEMRTYEHEKTIEELKARIKDSRDTLEYYRSLNSSLDTDKETMERIVREQYHMQRPNEDVYVFE